MATWNFEPALRTSVSLAVFTCLGVAATGCGAHSKYMIEPRLPVPTIAPPNASVVVFVRPSQYDAHTATTILDDHGMFIGDGVAGSEFAVTLPPGPHFFLAWAENTAPLVATLLPGRVYYVEVAPRMGFWVARTQLLAITPRSDTWLQLGAWMADATQLVPDAAAGQAYLNGRADAVAERIRRAHERFDKLSPVERDERTLYPEDGVPSGPVLVPAPSQPPPAVAPPELAPPPAPPPP